MKKFLAIFFLTIFSINSLEILSSLSNSETSNQSVVFAKTPKINSSEKDINIYFNNVRTNLYAGQDFQQVSNPLWIDNAIDFAIDGLIAGFDFWILDDIDALFDPKSTLTERTIAALMLFPS